MSGACGTSIPAAERTAIPLCCPSVLKAKKQLLNRENRKHWALGKASSGVANFQRCFATDRIRAYSVRVGSPLKIF